MRPAVAAGTVATTAAVAVGWWSLAVDGRIADSRGLPVLLTGVALLLLAPALAGSWRRPDDAVPAALVATAVVTVVGSFRLLAPAGLATLGALAWYLTPSVLGWVVVRRVGERVRTVPMWALWGVPVVLAVAAVAVSGPRDGADTPATRAATWAVLEGSASGAVVVGRQANPLALWPSAAGASTAWLMWSLWVLAAASVLGVRWWRWQRCSTRRDRIGTVLVVVVPTVACACIVASWPEELPAVAGAPSIIVDRWYTDLVLVAPVLLTAIAAVAACWDEFVRPRLLHTPTGAVQLDPATAPDALGHRVAVTLDDPSARLLFPDRSSPGGWVDDRGTATAPSQGPERATTVVLRSGETVAAIEHDSTLAGQPDLVDLAATTTSLALEHRARHAAAERQADELRRSATRLLTAGDDARRELRRRISDGPDRRLAELRGRIDAGGVSLEDVHSELKATLDSLRQLAHGDVPLSLREHGLSAAVEDFSAATGHAVTLVDCTPGPSSPELETLYLTVVETASANDGPIECRLEQRGDTWGLRIRGAGSTPQGVVADRLDTLGATVDARHGELHIDVPAGDATGSAP